MLSSGHCPKCGASYALVGRVHNCVPRRVTVTPPNVTVTAKDVTVTEPPVTVTQEHWLDGIERRLVALEARVLELGEMEERRVGFDGPGCLVGIEGNAWVITPGEEVELEPGKAVVVPAGTGEVIVEAEKGARFVRCVAPPQAA